MQLTKNVSLPSIPFIDFIDDNFLSGKGAGYKTLEMQLAGLLNGV